MRPGRCSALLSTKIPDENIWLAAVKLEADSNQIEQARELLATARQEAGTDRVWVKSVTFERRYGNNEDALRLACPHSAPLWILGARGEMKSSAWVARARGILDQARIKNPKSELLWLESAIVADRDYGDGWAWYYKFLTLHGTEVRKKRADVMSKCVSSEPKHGEVAVISKDLDTLRDSTEEILKAAANAVE
ncbi:hypothetical protein N7470_010072 [Penicillium chermesinum]|nr:hypothetical protein N7470_010072 [Penicillium chermesinum]